MRVSASTNNVDFSDATAEFSFVEIPAPVSARPSRVAAVGGTRVAVSGRGFREAAGVGLECVFSDPTARAPAPGSSPEPSISFPTALSSPAQIVSSELITCASPPLAAGRTVALSTRRAGDPDGPVSSSIAIESLHPARVLSITPSAGTRAAGRVLTVIGSDFPSGEDAFCSVGGVAGAKAQWVSSTALRCWAPPEGKEGGARVEVSFNGEEYSADGVEFRYGAVLEIERVEPTRASDAGGEAYPHRTPRNQTKHPPGHITCGWHKTCARTPGARFLSDINLTFNSHTPESSTSD